MFELVLKAMQKKIRISQYVLTTHAEEEMNQDSLTIFDIEGTFLTGEIVERQ
ncbi:DUF4258 domain-containing protein [Sphingobacteriales bacterium CHB3]|nr:DUF4258 domain-containing protein [Sphingobacteriales bacterium CHB3]